MDRNRLGAAVTELSDADVFGATAPAPAKEMSDADVLGSPASPQPISSAGHDFVNSTGVGGIMKAFGQGFREASGPEPLGLSPESTKFLSKIGIFAPEGQSKFDNPFQAFNEGIIVPAAAALDGAIRTVNGTYRGLQAVGVEAGLHRDIVSLPDAFMGTPHALGEIKTRSGLPKDQPLGSPLAAMSRPDPLQAFHGSPYSFDAFSTQHIGKGEGAQSYGHGLYFAENSVVASEYAEKLGKGEGNLFQVRINVDPEKMLDLDKLLKDQTPFVRDALKQAMGIDYYGNFDPALAERKWKDAQYADGRTAVRNGAIAFSDEKVSAVLSDAGIPGSKYLDSGSRANRDGTRNFVVFNENDIEITHKNGDAIETPQDKIAKAQDLGVIGQEKPPISEGTPKEVAERVVSKNADQSPGEKVTQELPGQQDPWQQRFDKFVGKLEAPEDVKQLIREAAKENGDFMPARQGDIPLSHVESIAEAAGVAPDEINARGLGRKLQNDNEVRVAMQMMLQVTDDVKAAAREVKADGSPESLIKLQETIMRRDLAVEQVVGMRAEWGRTGNVIQEFMRDVKDQEGLNSFLKDKGRTPADLRDIAHTLDALDGPQAARLLNDMRSPTAWDKFKFYWVNALISGPVTHAKYIVANAAFAGYESAVVTPIAGAIGAVRQALSRGEGIVTTAYHGTHAVFDGFSSKFQGTGVGAPHTTGKGHFFSTKPDTASGYAEGTAGRGNVKRVRVELQKPDIQEFAQHGVTDIIGQDEKLSEIIDAAKNGGRDGVILRSINGEAGHDLVVAFKDGAAKDIPYGAAVDEGAISTIDRVYMGEAAARTWGIVASVPDAMRAAVQAAKSGLQTPLPGELAQNIVPKRNKNLAYQQVPIEGKFGTFVGLPSRGASAIHSFFNFVGYRASIEGQAYRQAAKEGLKPTEEAFWQRRAAAADKPTAEMMNDAIEEGYRLTYISELGDTGRKLSAFVNATKVGQLVMPFTHIPLNILKRALEGTPAAFLDAETREALAGTKGAAKQDMAIARMVAGGAVGAWAMNQVLNDRMTGFGPTDPKERAQWMATGHQPYSVRIGDFWYSFNRFGSLGTMMGLYSNLAEVIPHLKPDAEELTKAIGMTVHSTGRLMEDEVGMQGLAGVMEAINEPDRKGARFVSNFAGSLLPYSSMQRQIASSMDPYMRETKSVVDGLRYYIPNQRQGLLPKRDWSGLPIANAGYGGDTAVPGVSSIIQHRNAVADPVAQEMATLDLHPAPPQDRIKGVKLPPKLYDVYQSTAGPFTREALTRYIDQPGWHDIPTSVRQDIFKHTIEATRQAAGAAMQMRYPELIQQGVADRLAKINGQKPTKLKD